MPPPSAVESPLVPGSKDQALATELFRKGQRGRFKLWTLETQTTCMYGCMDVCVYMYIHKHIQCMCGGGVLQWLHGPVKTNRVASGLWVVQLGGAHRFSWVLLGL